MQLTSWYPAHRIGFTALIFNRFAWHVIIPRNDRIWKRIKPIQFYVYFGIGQGDENNVERVVTDQVLAPDRAKETHCTSRSTCKYRQAREP